MHCAGDDAARSAEKGSDLSLEIVEDRIPARRSAQERERDQCEEAPQDAGYRKRVSETANHFEIIAVTGNCLLLPQHHTILPAAGFPPLHYEAADDLFHLLVQMLTMDSIDATSFGVATKLKPNGRLGA
jgi:hypothetical protein